MNYNHPNRAVMYGSMENTFLISQHGAGINPQLKTFVINKMVGFSKRSRSGNRTRSVEL